MQNNKLYLHWLPQGCIFNYVPWKLFSTVDDVMLLQVVTKDNHIVAMEFCRTEQQDDGSWTIDNEQTVKLKADFVISAFGSQLGQSNGMW